MRGSAHRRHIAGGPGLLRGGSMSDHAAEVTQAPDGRGYPDPKSAYVRRKVPLWRGPCWSCTRGHGGSSKRFRSHCGAGRRLRSDARASRPRGRHLGRPPAASLRPYVALRWAPCHPERCGRLRSGPDRALPSPRRRRCPQDGRRPLAQLRPPGQPWPHARPGPRPSAFSRPRRRHGVPCGNRSCRPEPGGRPNRSPSSSLRAREPAEGRPGAPRCRR